MLNPSTPAREARLRRRVAREGYTLHKCPERSRWYRDLGDWYIRDDFNNRIIEYKLDLDDVVEWLASRES